MTKKWMVGAIVALVIVAGCKKNVQSETESSNAPSEVVANADGNSDDKGDNAQMIKSSLAERALGSAYDKARQAVEKDESSAQGAVESFIVEYDKYKLSYKAHNPAVKSFYETQLRKRTSFENAYIYYLRAIDSYELAQDDFEKAITLRVLDKNWMNQLDNMEQLKEGIGLRGYAQTNPLQAYALEGFQMFDNMLKETNREITTYLLKAEVRQNLERHENKNIKTNDSSEGTKKTPKKVENKIGRNDPCPCGSGKKYKQCCGK